MPGYFVLHNEVGSALSEKPNGLATGMCSGYQALNIAFLTGATRVLLLGFDCLADGRKMHWFGDHPVKTPPSWLSTLPHAFAQIAKALSDRVEVINCSPNSALKCFPRADIASVLHDSAPAVVSA